METVDRFGPPGRREAQRMARREAILGMAEQSFLDYGYAGTTMSAIAARLGGSKGTLWNYFSDKDVLFAAVLDRATEAFQAQLTQILDPAAELPSALTRFAGEFLRKISSPGAIALHSLILAESARFPEIGRMFHARASGRTRALLAARLEAAMAKGEIRLADPAVAAAHFTGLCQSGCHLELLLRVITRADPEALDRDAANAVAAFLRAYAPDPTDPAGVETINPPRRAPD
jgi:AcrR family transcriptional regulator